jgi:hypothetical protein
MRIVSVALTIAVCVVGSSARADSFTLSGDADGLPWRAGRALMRPLASPTPTAGAFQPCGSCKRRTDGTPLSPVPSASLTPGLQGSAGPHGRNPQRYHHHPRTRIRCRGLEALDLQASDPGKVRRHETGQSALRRTGSQRLKPCKRLFQWLVLSSKVGYLISPVGELSRLILLVSYVHAPTYKRNCSIPYGLQ